VQVRRDHREEVRRYRGAQAVWPVEPELAPPASGSSVNRTAASQVLDSVSRSARTALPVVAATGRRPTSSIRTLARYARQGLLTPALTLPTGHHRWDLDDIRAQLRALRERDE
jgi:hypothetical protein